MHVRPSPFDLTPLHVLQIGMPSPTVFLLYLFCFFCFFCLFCSKKIWNRQKLRFQLCYSFRGKCICWWSGHLVRVAVATASDQSDMEWPTFAYFQVYTFSLLSTPWI